MQLFAHYIQPLVTWLEAHPNLALLFTFIVSFAESLAVIGSIIPGSVTMTAVGILAGSGIMRIDLTYLAAILGAIGGDSLSYALGIIFKDKLNYTYPFSRYPGLVIYGKEYFSKHGMKSVLIGRFIGPLRSIIPVIAGMMNMNKFHFALANIVSAIGWAWLYVTPGILIGAASSELSTESATRFLIFILLLLVGIWLFSVFIKWILLKTHHLLQVNLDQFWRFGIRHPTFKRMLNFLTPAYEENYFPTASLVILIAFSLLFSLFLILNVIHNTGISYLDEPINLFLQSVRTNGFEHFFIWFTQICQLWVISIFMIVITLIFISRKAYRAALYLFSLMLWSFLISLILKVFINIPRPQGLMVIQHTSSFPAINLTLLSSLCFAIALHLKQKPLTVIKTILRTTFTTIPFIVGLGFIYLGDHWLSDILASYFIAITVTLVHWLFLRRKKPNFHIKEYHWGFIFLMLCIATSVSYWFNHNQISQFHKIYIPQHQISESYWWGKNTQLLPLYRKNRVGHRVSLLNVQYAGSLRTLQNMLTINGWYTYHETLLNTLVERVQKHSNPFMPILTPLYINRKPALVMKYTTKTQGSLVLRLWRSNYILKEDTQNIWIGTLQPEFSNASSSNTNIQVINFIHIDESLFQFQIRQIPLNQQHNIPLPLEPKILMIRERQQFYDYIG